MGKVRTKGSGEQSKQKRKRDTEEYEKVGQFHDKSKF